MFLAGSIIRPALEFCQIIKLCTSFITAVEFSEEYVEDYSSDIKVL